MQLDSRRGGGTQHILEWGVFGLAFRWKVGVLLLKDGQSQHIAERQGRMCQTVGREGEAKNNSQELKWNLTISDIKLNSSLLFMLPSFHPVSNARLYSDSIAMFEKHEGMLPVFVETGSS